MGQSITIELPQSVQLSEFELRMTLASKLYERGVLSAEQGAALAGISLRSFVELLGAYGVSVFGYQTLQEMESEEQYG